MIKIGTGKADITAYKEGIGMLGYGVYFNIMMSIETPLLARSFVFKNGSEKVVFTNCEICFISPSIKRGVIKKLQRHYKHLGYSDHNVMLSAQHTHSGPSGYSHHGLYNMNTPGFVIEIYSKIIDGIVRSIVEADEKAQPGRLFLGSSEFAPDKEVGFNRSLKAYLKNPEAESYTEDELHLAIDRKMTLLKAVSAENKDIGCINWFGTHTTNLPNSSTLVCSDNKGYAAKYFEDAFSNKSENFVSIFAQGSAGDVSPNFTFNKKRKFTEGKYDGKFDDCLQSAKYNGQLQFEKAKEIYEEEAFNEISERRIDSGLRYSNFGDIAVNPKFCGGRENVRTSPSCMGVAFLGGALRDGPGMIAPLLFLCKGLSLFMKGFEYMKALFMPKEYGVAMRQKYAAQGAKHIAMETGARKILATHNISKLIIPGWADESIKNLKEFHKRGALDNNPWTPQILPLQIIAIGEVAICGFPFEITTIASKRLQKSLEGILIGPQFKQVILNPYSNAYNGYITTYEEYQEQMYEGGHTVFGEWSLAALQTEFEKLAVEMLKPKAERNLHNDIIPPNFSDEDLNKFKHFKGQYYLRKKKQLERIERIKARKAARKEKKASKNV